MYVASTSLVLTQPLSSIWSHFQDKKQSFFVEGELPGWRIGTINEIKYSLSTMSFVNVDKSTVLPLFVLSSKIPFVDDAAEWIRNRHHQCHSPLLKKNICLQKAYYPPNKNTQQKLKLIFSENNTINRSNRGS